MLLLLQSELRLCYAGCFPNDNTQSMMLAQLSTRGQALAFAGIQRIVVAKRKIILCLVNI